MLAKTSKAGRTQTWPHEPSGCRAPILSTRTAVLPSARRMMPVNVANASATVNATAGDLGPPDFLAVRVDQSDRVRRGWPLDLNFPHHPREHRFGAGEIRCTEGAAIHDHKFPKPLARREKLIFPIHDLFTREHRLSPSTALAAVIGTAFLMSLLMCNALMPVSCPSLVAPKRLLVSSSLTRLKRARSAQAVVSTSPDAAWHARRDD
jgi:hypothetical protein